MAAQYDAFISYHRASGTAAAAAVQTGLQRFARPWLKRRALAIYRDESDLGAVASIEGSLLTALEASRYLIVIATPGAAASPWVESETRWWCANRGTDTLLLVLVDGRMPWAPGDGPVALPPTLAAALKTEPRYVDLSQDSQPTLWTIEHPPFAEAIASLASPIHDKPKADLFSAEAREQRARRRTIRVVGAALIALTLASVIGAWSAIQQKNKAEQRLKAAQDVADALLVEVTDGLDNLIGSQKIRRRLTLEVERVVLLLKRSGAEDIATVRLGLIAAMRTAQQVEDSGTHADALQHFSKLRAAAQRALAQFPESFEIRRDLAVAMHGEADAQVALHQRDEALSTLTAAAEMHAALAQQQPRNLTHMRDRAIVAQRIGNLHLQQDALAKARQSYEHARQLLKHDGLNAADDQSVIDGLIVETLLREGKIQSAFAQTEAHLANTRRALEGAPNNKKRVRSTAVALSRHAMVLRRSGDQANAQRALLEASQLERRLLVAQPDSPEAMLDLAVTLERLASLESAMRVSSARDRAVSAARYANEAMQVAGLSRRVVAVSLAAFVRRAQIEVSASELAKAKSICDQGIGLLTKQHRRSDVELQRLEDALHRVRAEALVGLAQSSLAVTEYEDLIAGARERPGLMEVQRQLARDLLSLAELHTRLGEPQRALPMVQEAVHIARKAAALRVGDLYTQDLLGVALEKSGDVLTALAKPKEALLLYEESLTISRMLAAKSPDDREMAQELAVGFEKLAQSKLDLSDVPGARAAIDACLAIRQAAHDAQPGDAEFSRTLAIAFSVRADIDSAAKQPKSQLEALKASVVLLRQVHAARPHLQRARVELFVGIRRLGIANADQGDHPAARVALEDALQVAEPLWSGRLEAMRFADAIIAVLGRLADACHRLGLPDDALKALQRVTNLEAELLELEPSSSRRRAFMGALIRETPYLTSPARRDALLARYDQCIGAWQGGADPLAIHCLENRAAIRVERRQVKLALADLRSSVESAAAVSKAAADEVGRFEHVRALGRAAEILTEAGPKQASRARKHAKTALTLLESGTLCTGEVVQPCAQLRRALTSIVGSSDAASDAR